MVAAGERFAKRGAHRRGFEKIAAAAGHRASRKHARLRALSKYAFSISSIRTNSRSSTTARARVPGCST